MADVNQYLNTIRTASKANQDFSNLNLGQPSSLPPSIQPSTDEADFERKPHGVWAALDLLNRLQYPVANTMRRLSDPNRHYSASDYIKGAWRGFTGKERSQTTDTLTNLGWRPYTKKGKLAKAAVGLAGDIITDPLTYASFVPLTKLGKAAQAGKLIKVGDTMVDLSKVKNVNKMRSLLEKGMRAAGETADVINEVQKGYKGVKTADFAKKLVGDLNKYGQVAEVVELAPTWAKQYRAGQRALIGWSLPRIVPSVGGDVVKTPNPLNAIKYSKSRKLANGQVVEKTYKLGDELTQKLFNAATMANRRVQAGRALANKTLWNALPEATDAIQESAKAKNLFRVGDKFFDLGNSYHADRFRAEMIRQMVDKGIDKETIRGFENYLKDVSPANKGLAVEAEGFFKDLGLVGERATLEGLRNKRIAAKFGTKYKGVGSAVNTLADAFNAIPTPVKMIRRYASGASSRVEDEAAERIQQILGKDGENVLRRGLAPKGKVAIVDSATGKVLEYVKEGRADSAIRRFGRKGINAVANDYGEELAKRITAVEMMGFKPVWEQLDEIRKAGKPITKQDLKKAVEMLGKNTNEGTAWGKMLREAPIQEGYASPFPGWSDETIKGVQDTIDKWDNVDDMMRASDALYATSEFNKGIGGITDDISRNFGLYEGLAPLHRTKDLDDEARILASGSIKSADEARLASSGQTFYDAWRGARDSERAQWLLDNADKIVKVDPKGRPIYGRDIIGVGYRDLKRNIDRTKRNYDLWQYSADVSRGKQEAYEQTLKNTKEILPDYQLEKDRSKFIKRRNEINHSISYNKKEIARMSAKRQGYENTMNALVEKATKAREDIAKLDTQLRAAGNKSPHLEKLRGNAIKVAEEAEAKLKDLTARIAKHDEKMAGLQGKLDGLVQEYESLAKNFTTETTEKLQRLGDSIYATNQQIAKEGLRFHPITPQLANKKKKLLAELNSLKESMSEADYMARKAEIDALIDEARLTPQDLIDRAKQAAADAKYDVKLLDQKIASPTARGERQLERGYRNINTLEDRALNYGIKAEDIDPSLARLEGNLSKAEQKSIDLIQQRKAAIAKGQEKVNKTLAQMDERLANLTARTDFRQANADFAFKQYENAVKQLEDFVNNNAKMNKFSTDFDRNLLKSIKTKIDGLRGRLILQGIVEKCPDIPKDGRIPAFFVKADDVIPRFLMNKAEMTGETLGDFASIVKTMGGEELVNALKGKMIPAEMVSGLEAILRPNTPTSNSLLLGYDWVMSQMKRFMLSAPATHTRNAVSSFLMAFAAGDFTRPQDYANFIKSLNWNAVKKLRHDSDVLIDGRKYKISELWDLFQRYGGADSNKTIQEYLAKPHLRNRNWLVKGMEGFTEGANWVQGKVANATENTFRFNHFINELQKGRTAEEAIESVAKHFYDYSDLSAFERNVLRRAMPFYTFFRKNAEANLRYLRSNIGYLNFPYRLAKNINTITEGDENAVPLSWLDNPKNEWLAKQGAYRLPWDGSRLMPLQNYLPAVDVAQILNPKEGMESVIAGLTPLAKQPYELLTNQDTFTGRPIKTDAYPTRYYLGMEMNPYVVHALRPLRIIDVADRAIKALTPEATERHGMVARNKDIPLMERARNTGLSTLGTKAYDQDRLRIKKNMIRTLQDQISDINFRISRYPNMLPAIKQRLMKEREAKLRMIQRIEQGKDI